MYEIDLLKLSEFFKNEIIVEQRKKIKELEEKLSDDNHYQERLIRDLERTCKNYEKLEKENEELKNFHINLVGVKECEIKELIKYKQALKEIKEIAGRIKETCEEDEGRYSCACDYKKQILKKISEVIDD